MTLAILPEIAMPLWLATVLAVRPHGRKQPVPPNPFMDPPTVYSNLPQIEKVDIHALFKKWED